MAWAIYLNGEAFVVSDGPTQRAVTAAVLEMEGSATAEFRLTEKDQTPPAGRYRSKVSGDKLILQRASAKTGDPWDTAQDLLTLDSEGITPNVPLDTDGIRHFVAHVVGYITPKQAAGVVEWLQGHGPTADPDGYVMITVGENKLGILPYWDYGR